MINQALVGNAGLPVELNDVVIRLVLPYIMTVADEESDPYVESDSYASSDDESSDSM